MKDLGQALNEKIEQITENWVLAVHQDSEIVSARKLAYEAVRNSLPEILEELSKLLSEYNLNADKDYSEKVEEKSLYHGFVRAQQGYDTAEIVREYRILRQVLLSEMEPDLLEGSSFDTLHAVRLVDRVFDKIITHSLERYIESRVTEIRQMQGQLVLTNQELSRLVKAQKENLSFMAHELKTPLNSIIGHSALLLRKQQKKLKSIDTATNLDQIELVMRNGRRLLKIINDTLEISRHDEGQIQLHLEPIDASIIIQEILEDGLEPLAQEKELTLTIDMSEAPKSVLGDSLRIQQLVSNLVSNAIRYTDSGSIEIICRRSSSNFWEIVVRDTGIGISEEQRTRIFDPYVQDNSQNRSPIGTGLGLAIVSRIVTLMQGDIQMVSNVGEGTTFTIQLPFLDPENFSA